jgi:hypothetical protein
VSLKLHKPDVMTAAQARAGVTKVPVKLGDRTLTGNVIVGSSQFATVTVYDAWTVLGHPAYLTFNLAWAEVAKIASEDRAVELEDVK